LKPRFILHFLRNPEFMFLSSRLHFRANPDRPSERGYILLTLLLMVAVLTIAALAIVPTIKFEIRRDREEEMIHRGVQYSRAIRAYYKKFGRYPTRLEDLESTNNLRFLRKRYKDPTTGKDFKLLHFGEVKMTFSGTIAGGNIPGANPIGGPANGGMNGPGGMAQGSSFGGGASSFGGGANFGGGQNSGFGANSSSFGSSNSPGSPSQTTANQQSQTPGSDSSSPTSTSSTPGQSPDQSASAQPGPGGSISSGQLGGATFGGGPIVGVVSTSKEQGYREFNKKKKYEEWQFIYDPSSDRGGLLNTPNQPPLQGMTQQQLQPGQGQGQSGFPPTTSGPIPGMMNNPNPGMEPNGPVAPAPQNPQQQ
jgi:type II secretory pathway pseudopilin PulG